MLQKNFLFAKKDGIAGADLYKKIKQEGILIRHFNTPGIEDFVRIQQKFNPHMITHSFGKRILDDYKLNLRKYSYILIVPNQVLK